MNHSYYNDIIPDVSVVSSMNHSYYNDIIPGVRGVSSMNHSYYHDIYLVSVLSLV